MSIRLYGDFESSSSFSRVSEGFASVFRDAHKFDLLHWGNDLDYEEQDQPGATADVGIFVGSHNNFHQTRRGKHKELYVMVAPNSNKVGSILEENLKEVQNLLAPSHWAAQVLSSLFPDKTVRVVPHGIDPRFRPQDLRKLPKMTFLHLSSSVLERKGTQKLLYAWAALRHPNTLLLISVPGSHQTCFFRDIVFDLNLQDSVKITDRLDYTPTQLARLYTQVHFVVQPSRGEGFGMVPLEARACGTPVIATTCTGHSEHMFGEGVVPIQSGRLAPIDDVPRAMAPSLSQRDIENALDYAFRNQEDLSAAAMLWSENVRIHWSWENQLKEFKDELSRKFPE